MNAKIRDTYMTPAGKWWVIDPDTEVFIDANSYKNLRGKFISHRQANHLPVEIVDQEIADQVCKREAPEFCQEWPKSVEVAGGPGQPTLLDMVGNFTESISYWAMHGFPVASQQKFNDRLAICQKCPFFDGSSFWGAGKCKKCGCCGGLKPWMATAKCPDSPPRW